MQQLSINVALNARYRKGEGMGIDIHWSLLTTRCEKRMNQVDVDVHWSLLTTWYEKCMNQVDVDVHWSLLTRRHEKHTNRDHINHVT